MHNALHNSISLLEHTHQSYEPYNSQPAEELHFTSSKKSIRAIHFATRIFIHHLPCHLDTHLSTRPYRSPTMRTTSPSYNAEDITLSNNAKDITLSYNPPAPLTDTPPLWNSVTHQRKSRETFPIEIRSATPLLTLSARKGKFHLYRPRIPETKNDLQRRHPKRHD